MADSYIFEMSWKVRDYECDLQGIVNNAVYMHYLEFTRSEYLNSTGTNLAELHAKGIDIVLVKITMALKSSLHAGDEIVSKMNLHKERIKYIFEQEIYRKSDNKLSCKATVELVSVVNGKLSNSEIVDNLLFNKLDNKNN